jgi:hypothetical protein
VVRAALDEAERARMRAAGLARAGPLTWDRAARETDALLQRVAGRAEPAASPIP